MKKFVTLDLETYEMLRQSAQKDERNMLVYIKRLIQADYRMNFPKHPDGLFVDTSDPHLTPVPQPAKAERKLKTEPEKVLSAADIAKGTGLLDPNFYDKDGNIVRPKAKPTGELARAAPAAVEPEETLDDILAGID